MKEVERWFSGEREHSDPKVKRSNAKSIRNLLINFSLQKLKRRIERL